MNSSSALRWATLATLCLQLPVRAATNEWTNPASGAWEEPYWSLGTLPGPDQDLVAIRNSGWKAVGITSSTVLNYPGSLSVRNLEVDAPIDAYSQVLLNWAGQNVPLTVGATFFVGPRGSLASHGSALRASTLLLNGTAFLADGSGADVGQIVLDSVARLELTNAFLSSSNISVLSGSVAQAGGAHACRWMDVAAVRSNPWAGSSGAYVLNGGVFYSGHLSLSVPNRFSEGIAGDFLQTAGSHTNATMILNGWIEQQRYFLDARPSGRYVLSGGLLSSDSTLVDIGAFVQDGGTNYTGALQVASGGVYTLTAGSLVTTNVALTPNTYLGGNLNQVGGSHTVQRLLMGSDPAIAGYVPATSYLLSGGALKASSIELRIGAALKLYGGQASNAELFSFAGGDLNAGAVNVQLGKLAVAAGRVDMDPADATGPTLLTFRDSRDLVWSGLPWNDTLRILNWHPAYDRIFVGVDGQSLTSAQVEKIVFVRPYGWPQADYPAELLPSGELVPKGAGKAGDFTYMVTNGLAIITGYLGAQSILAIPSSIGGWPVRGIGDFALSNLGFLSSVSLPAGLTDVGDSAFFRCTNLAFVSLPAGLLSISEWAFGSCSNLLTMPLPDSVRSVSFYAFYGCVRLSNIKLSPALSELSFGLLEYCTSLPKLDIPANINSVEPFALAYCSSLTNLVFPEGVTNIHDLACISDTALRTVSIPGTVTKIGLNVFGNCSSLESITVAPANPNYTSLDGVLFDKARTTLIQFPSGRGGHYRVPDGVQSVYNWAFQYSSNLVSVTLPASVAYVDYQTFADCPKLTAVYFEGNAPWVAEDAFHNSPYVIVYYRPGTTGWTESFAGRPTAMWGVSYPKILTDDPSFGMKPQGFSFSVTGAVNSTIVIEAGPTISDPGWVPLSTNTLITGALYFVDPNTKYPAQFYRVVPR